METLPSILILVLYYAILGTLAVYGLHRITLVALYYRTKGQGAGSRSGAGTDSSADAPRPTESWPAVTVQLPIFNERYVAARLIDAACRLDYPRDKLQIQVLDDSTDETSAIVAARVAEYQALGIQIQHLHRSERSGFKAGALEAGLRQASGELLAVFDADFVPGADFLVRTVPHFQDPKIAMVQARWDHLNRHYSLLTRIQAILLDGHFVVEHAARNRSGRFFNFNGTAGVWRQRAIVEAGGWQHDTLTEDLDLSYRCQLAGWRFLFLSDVTVPAELPVDINAFKGQQHRWAKGSMQTARKLLGRVLRARLPWEVKAEALVHLTNNSAYVLMIGLSVLIFPAMLVRRGGEPWVVLWVDLPLFVAATLSVLAFYVVSQKESRAAWRTELKHLPALMGLGIGLAVNNSRAVLDGLSHDGGVFERTPKYRIESRTDKWSGKAYRVRRNGSAIVEGMLAVYFVGAVAIAFRLDMWFSLPFLLLFMHGYCYMLFLTIRSGRSPLQGHRAPAILALRSGTDRN